MWRFELRRNVKFHDGTPFTADDVVFSFARAAGDGSDMKGYTSSIKQVRKVDDHTVEIETTAPFPILPDVISLVYVMSKKWCEDNKAEKPVDKQQGHREHRVLPRQRHRAVPTEGAPADDAQHLRAQRHLLGQGRRQRR